MSVLSSECLEVDSDKSAAPMSTVFIPIPDRDFDPA